MTEPQTLNWRDSIDLTLRCWEDYEAALKQLSSQSVADGDLPGVLLLQSILSKATCNLQGNPIQFVPPSQLPADNYEEQIFNTGRVSTRLNNWHDVCNALVWWRFPALKAAMNATHFGEIQKQNGTDRGRLRDALTLWDECGVIVASTNHEVLQNLAQRNWKGAFQDLAHHWKESVRVYICGHALLEKYLSPYKSITAHSLLVQLEPESFPTDRERLVQRLDRSLAEKLLHGDLIGTTADLSPLPLAGIPGWWSEGEQDEEFYADSSVFRIPAVSMRPAPVVKLDLCASRDYKSG